MRRRLLLRDQSGAALTEFGLILPVFAVLLMGAMDMGHSLYTRSVLEGAIQKAARDSGLESGTAATQQAVIDAFVKNQLRDLGIRNADVTITRRFYRTFTAASAAAGEPFTDTNANGACDSGEPYEDHNNNSVHDPDGADGGQGGAKDTVQYTVRVNYPRLFPMAGLIGLPQRVQMEAITVMNNQPYGDQSAYSAMTVRNCPGSS